MPYLVAPLLLLHTVGARMQKDPAGKGRIESLGPLGLWSLIPLAALILVIHPITSRAALTALHFMVGVLLGALIGVNWRKAGLGKSFISLGLLGFTAITVAQLALIFLESGSPTAFHSEAVLSWGASNYIAGVLVTAAFVLIGQKPFARLSVLVGFAALVAALGTLSRGAILAVGVAAAAHLWSTGRTPASRFALRLSCIGLPVLGLTLLGKVTALRSVGGYDPTQNTDARFILYRAAWDQFRTNPIFGTGWTGLEGALPSQFVTSLAHNIVLSLLQIGGTLGIIMLAILLRLNGAAWRTASARGAIAGAATISMSDPFYEGLVGSMLILAFIVSVTRYPGSPPDANSDPRTSPASTSLVRNHRQRSGTQSLSANP
ncbi:O-antigen ligase family protein [Janibacter sp. CX7]|uniref:O-antigen ligase family protein n=1 Tax=Janibacter sp. CX7 TaxID=2963431 RepID=UPI0020CC91FE|nr:O-antigen ligase family protein [Janibacter sp. CX7]UTT66876.1 O-antigen ligase family protein [Janibacter sp. CX7]